jgi:transposase
MTRAATDDAADDDAVRALRELRAGLERTIAQLDAAARRADQLIEQRGDGRTWLEIVSAERPPLVVEAITRALDELGELGSQFRREEALALRRDGATVTQIGELFRVTRQRASALVQPRPAPRKRRA